MKIRLLRSLAVEPLHGCLAGTVWDVEITVLGGEKSRCPRYVFMAETGQMITAFSDEAEVIAAKPEPRTISYQEHYCQPENIIVMPDPSEDERQPEPEDEDAPFEPVFGKPGSFPKKKPGRKRSF